MSISGSDIAGKPVSFYLVKTGPKAGKLRVEIEGFGDMSCSKYAEILRTTVKDAKVEQTQSIGDDDTERRGEFVHG